MAKKVFVSTADMGPQLVADRVPAGKDGGKPPEELAAEALAVELVGLARERALSRTWRAKAKDGKEVAVVVVADSATPEERQLFARMAEDVHAAGDSLPGVLRVRAMTTSRNAFLSDLWTAGSARDLAALKWSPRRRARFVLRAAQIIAEMHALGLVHGCLCSANLLLDDALDPVVAEAGTVPVHAVLQRGGEAAMYTAFAAPEVIAGGVVDARSDVFALGRILEEATRGDEPCAALRDVVQRAAAADPAARYATVAELATALDGVLPLLSDADPAAPAPVASPPVRPSPPVNRRPEPAVSPSSAAESPSLAWMPPRVLGIAGLVAVVGAIAASLLVGGSNEALRPVLTIALVAGAALATTLLRPRADLSISRGLSTQLALAAGIGAVALVVDPLSYGYRFAAQRHVHGDDASRRAAVAEVVRLGRDFRGLSLARVDLSGADLRGADLRGVDLSGANLAHTDLFGAEVQGASFDGANLAGASLDQVQLELANLGAASCDGETRLPQGWRCRDGRVGRVASP